MTEDRRITKTKAAIREAFFSMIKEKNVPKITVTEIAKRANINRKTFYLHYDSTEAIINEFYQDLISEFLLILEKNDFFDRSFDVSSLFQSLNLLIDWDIDLYRHIAKMPSYFSFWEEIKNIVKSVVVEAMADGLKMPQDELELYAEFYSAGVTSAYFTWLKNEVNLTETEVANIVGAAAFYGFQKLLPQEDR
ncbi:MAG: TetR/AcrR family transcriptional regulator [Sedimentibacter sp.]